MRVQSGFGLTVVLIIAGCAAKVGDPVLDGWPVGTATACASEPRCPELLAVATEGFDRRDPGHAAVVTTTLHDEGVEFDDLGQMELHTRSGACCWVARFELADGSVRAIGVGYPGISKVAIAVDGGP